MKTSLYDILRITDGASPEEIATAYQTRKNSLQNAVDHESQNELKLVQLAFETLSNPSQRTRYDQSFNAQAANNDLVIHASDESGSGATGGTIKLIIAISIAVTSYVLYQKGLAGHPGSDAIAHPPSPTQRQDGLAPASSPLANSDVAPAPPVASLAPPAPVSPELPIPANPQPTGSFKPADIYDINAVPLPAPATQRRAYAAFLALRGSRAFVICNDRRVISYSGNPSFISQKLASLPSGCSTYAIDNNVVWAGM